MSVLGVGFTCLLARHSPLLQLPSEKGIPRAHPQLFRWNSPRDVHEFLSTKNDLLIPSSSAFNRVPLPHQVLITSPFSERSLSSSEQDYERFSLPLPYCALTLRRHPTNRECVGTAFAANMRAAVKSLENCPSRTSLYR